MDTFIMFLGYTTLVAILAAIIFFIGYTLISIHDLKNRDKEIDDKIDYKEKFLKKDLTLNMNERDHKLRTRLRAIEKQLGMASGEDANTRQEDIHE